jgi:hypothetical protein
MKITLQGMEDAQKQLERIARATAAMGQYKAYVGSRMPYAYGIERGQHRKSGKLARRAGGAFYLQSAVEEVLSDADHDISAGLTKVTAPGRWVLKRIALWARRLARVNVPREKGKLRRSIRAEVRKG